MANLQEFIATSGKWLLSQQDDVTGGWPDRSGMHPNALNTAESIIALIDSGMRAAGADDIRKAVKYLTDHQISEGEHKGAWPRDVHSDDGSTEHITDLVRTSFCIQALIRAGAGIDTQSTKDGVAWLINHQNSDNGWSFSPGQASDLMPTNFALYALLDVYNACKSQCKDQIEDGLDFLVKKFYKAQPKDAKGSFGDPGPLQAVHTIHAAFVLQKARKNKLSKYADEERSALDWLLRHPDEAIRLVEERVEIDPVSHHGDYGYLFMTDTLLLRLLSGSDDKQHYESRLAREAITKLKDRQDPTTGAFYGERAFTWSTAKSIWALAVAKSLAKHEYLPSRSPEYRGVRAGWPIMGLALLLTVASGALMYTGTFSLIGFLFYAMLMIGCLLAFGLIREKSFVELYVSIINRFPAKRV